MTTIIDDDCNIPQKKCETSKKYDVYDIADIADKCGVDIYDEKGKLKKRKQLCKEIADLQRIDGMDEPLPVISDPIISIPEAVHVANEPMYTEDMLKKYLKAKLLEIAEELSIKKWKNRAIKGYNKPDIIEAILTAIAVEEPFPVPLPEPTVIIVEDDPPTEIPIEIIEKPDKKTLNKKKVKELLEQAKEYGITKWKNKNINYQKKADIIDAIIDYIETNVAPKIVITPPRTPMRTPMRTPPRTPIRTPPRTPIRTPPNSPANIKDLINQKRQELIKILNLKEQEKCDPYEGKYCSDDNICDMSKTPNVCISKEEAQYKENKGLGTMFGFTQKNIIGNKQQEKEFADYLGGAEETKNNIFEEEIPIPITKNKMCNVCTYVNDPDIVECIICNSDLTEEQVNNIMFPEGTPILEREAIPEGTKIAELNNIEDILNEIQKTEDTKINLQGLAESKKKVLYCLGLLN